MPRAGKRPSGPHSGLNLCAPIGSGAVQAIGFDMDYTLAQYRPETFEVLAYNLTVDKLVDVFGYPPVRPWPALGLGFRVCPTLIPKHQKGCPACRSCMHSTAFSTVGPGAPGHLLDFNRLLGTWAHCRRGCGHGHALLYMPELYSCKHDAAMAGCSPAGSM